MLKICKMWLRCVSEHSLAEFACYVAKVAILVTLIFVSIATIHHYSKKCKYYIPTYLEKLKRLWDRHCTKIDIVCLLFG